MTLRRGLVPLAIQAALVAAFCAGWWAVAAHRAVNPLFVPPPAAVAVQVGRLIGTGAFWNAAAVTTLETVEAYALAVVLGIACGFFVGRSRRLTAAFEPLLAGIFAIPITLFFPLFAVYFGIGPASKVAFGATYGFFPIALNTIAGFAGVDPLFVRAAHALGARSWPLLRHVYLPGALPTVAVGLRIGFFITFASVLGGETLSSAAGIGYAIAHQADLLNSAQMYAYIAIVLAVTIAMNLLVTWAERRTAGG